MDRWMDGQMDNQAIFSLKHISKKLNVIRCNFCLALKG